MLLFERKVKQIDFNKQNEQIEEQPFLESTTLYTHSISLSPSNTLISRDLLVDRVGKQDCCQLSYLYHLETHKERERERRDKKMFCFVFFLFYKYSKERGRSKKEKRILFFFFFFFTRQCQQHLSSPLCVFLPFSVLLS